MGGGECGGPRGIAGVDGCRRQRQGFGHGGAGAVKPEEGDARVPDGKGGADALIQQISGEKHVQIAVLKLRLAACCVERKLL